MTLCKQNVILWTQMGIISKPSSMLIRLIVRLDLFVLYNHFVLDINSLIVLICTSWWRGCILLRTWNNYSWPLIPVWVISFVIRWTRVLFGQFMCWRSLNVTVPCPIYRLQLDTPAHMGVSSSMFRVSSTIGAQEWSWQELAKDRSKHWERRLWFVRSRPERRGYTRGAYLR